MPDIKSEDGSDAADLNHAVERDADLEREPSVRPDASIESDATSPVGAGLIALYTFDRSGTTVRDMSGVAPALDLTMYGSGVSRIEGGVVFTPSDNPIIVSPGPATKIIRHIKESNEITVELWSRATVLNQTGPARLFGMAVENHHRNISILHGPAACGSHESGAFYQIRVLNVGEDNGCDPIVSPAPAANVTLALSHVVYTQATDGTQRLYIDGQLSAEDVDTEKSFAHFYDDTPLALGNEPNSGMDATIRDNGRYWQGELYHVAVYDRALSQNEVTQNFAAGHQP